uniref:Uncharacterized protein n=1 Tax=Strigamia maritima TaxID=126957 RepID=T1IPS3_STRMM
LCDRDKNRKPPPYSKRFESVKNFEFHSCTLPKKMDKDKMAKLAFGHLAMHGPSKLDDIVKGVRKYFANHTCEEILPFLLREILKAKNGILHGRVQIIDTTGDPLDNIYRVIPKGQSSFCATESCLICGRDLTCPKGCKEKMENQQ